jgi:predicted membrane chloride channel (bestrophin family)
MSNVRGAIKTDLRELIRRQHAEIERLREENEEMEVLFKALQEAFARAKEAALRREDV